MSELQSDTPLFAGRYEVIRLSGTDQFGYIYEAVDHSDESRVLIHEVFKAGMCRRDAESQNMAILKASAPEASALYHKFSDYVSSLHDGKVSGMPRLIHAFKDHGTAYYVLPASTPVRKVPDKDIQPEVKLRQHNRDDRGEATERTSAHDRHVGEAAERLAASDAGHKLASYRNALLWYRIIIVLLLAIIALVVYLNFFTDSPKVTATGTADTPIETVVPAVTDSISNL